MILNVMAKKELIPFVLLGYCAIAYFKLPIIGVAILGTTVALWFISIQEKETNQVQKQKKWRLNLKMASNKLQKKRLYKSIAESILPSEWYELQ